MDLQVSNDAVGQTCLLRLSIPSGQRSIKERCLYEERQACLLDLEGGSWVTCSTCGIGKSGGKPPAVPAKLRQSLL